jgi:hypothetical protein
VKNCNKIAKTQLALFANFGVVWDKTAQNFFFYTVNVSQNPILYLFPVMEAPFCQKRSKSLNTHTQQSGTGIEECRRIESYFFEGKVFKKSSLIILAMLPLELFYFFIIFTFSMLHTT